MKFNLKNMTEIKTFLTLPGKRANYVKKMAAIALYSRLTGHAPVLTGRYRWGFNCTINGIDYGVPPPAPDGYVKNKQQFYSFDAERAVKAFMSVRIDDDVFVSNSLPYAEALENGHSRQAPTGIFRVTIPELREDLKKYAAQASGKDGGF